MWEEILAVYIFLEGGEGECLVRIVLLKRVIGGGRWET